MFKNFSLPNYKFLQYKPSMTSISLWLFQTKTPPQKIYQVIFPASEQL